MGKKEADGKGGVQILSAPFRKTAIPEKEEDWR